MFNTHTEAMMKPNRGKIAIQNPKSSPTAGNNDDDDDHKHGLGDLPECLLEEILTRLPLKSMFMSKTVSKQWNSIISAPDFSKSYVSVKERDSPNRALLLLCSNNDGHMLLINGDHHQTRSSYSRMSQRLSSMHNGSPFTMLDFPFPKPRIPPYLYTVVSSSNGLLLCRADAFSQGIYGICNPITRQWIVLRRHKECYPMIPARDAFVAKVDKSSSKLVSYRVVRLKVLQDSLMGELCMDVYDSDIKKWRNLKVKLPGMDFHIDMKPLQPACLNEIIHWEVQQGEVHYAAAVDPYKHGDDLCRLMVLPTTSIFSIKTIRDSLLGVCNGRLQYLKVHRESHAMT